MMSTHAIPKWLGLFLTVVMCVGAWSDPAHAIPVYDVVGRPGTATITHDADLGDALPASVVTGPFTIPETPPHPFQYPENTIHDDKASSSAAGAIYAFSQPNVFGLVIPRDVGVEQTDTGAAQVFAGPSSLRIDFTATWEIVDTQFGPGLEAGVRGPLVGEVGGDGGFVRLEVVVAFVSTTQGNLRSPITFPLLEITEPGPFSVAVIDMEDVPPPDNFLPVGDLTTISGRIEFIARSGRDGKSEIRVGGGGMRNPSPEPTGLLLGVLGFLGLVFCARRRRLG